VTLQAQALRSCILPKSALRSSPPRWRICGDRNKNCISETSRRGVCGMPDSNYFCRSSVPKPRQAWAAALVIRGRCCQCSNAIVRLRSRTLIKEQLGATNRSTALKEGNDVLFSATRGPGVYASTMVKHCDQLIFIGFVCPRDIAWRQGT